MLPTALHSAGTTPSRRPPALQLRWRCGACNDCRFRPATAAPLPHTPPARVLAVDIQEANVQLLSRLFQALNITGAAHHAAFTNHSGTIATYESAPLGHAGLEHIGIDRADWIERRRVSAAMSATTAPGRKGGPKARRRVKVGTETVDEFASVHGLERLTMLSIDAEGWDPLILEGAERMIRSRRVEVISFEYHFYPWRAVGRTLRGTLRWLGAAGYSCFWSGDRSIGGRLARLGAEEREGWCSELESVDRRANRANVVCSHRVSVLAAIEPLELASSPLGGAIRSMRSPILA